MKFRYHQDAITHENITTCVKYKQVVRETTVEPTGSDVLFDSYNTIAQAFNRYVGDVVKAWPVIIISGLGESHSLGSSRERAANPPPLFRPAKKKT